MSRHEWVNSTLGHGANMCRHCLMTDAEAAALGCLDTCDAERTPTDAEIEAMAEKLWDVWRAEEMAHVDVDYDWPMLNGRAALASEGHPVPYEYFDCSAHAAAFRAMARVALEGRG